MAYTYIPKRRPPAYLKYVVYLLLFATNAHYRLMCRLGKFRFLDKNHFVIVTDIFRDVDDSLAIQLCHGLIQCGLTLHIVIANLQDPLLRARGVKGLLQTLGLGHVPVAVGSRVNNEVQHFPDETEMPFLAGEHEVEKDGRQSMIRTLENAGSGMVTWVLLSGVTDAAEIMRSHPLLCQAKLKKITWMSGTLPELDANGMIQLDPTAANNKFDWESAQFLCRRSQELGIPLVISTRHAAAQAKVPFSFYQELAATGHPGGIQISMGQGGALNRLWWACNEPIGGYYRKAINLPDRCDRPWFVKAKLNGVDPDIGPDGQIWELAAREGVTEIYDPMAMLAGVDELAPEFFRPQRFKVNGVTHQVIGLTPEEHGVVAPDDFRAFVMQSMKKTLEVTLPIAKQVLAEKSKNTH